MDDFIVGVSASKAAMPPQSAPPPAFHVMLKPRGAICNLDCAYCFYLAKEALYPAASFRMSEEVLEAFVRQYIQAQRVPEVTFAWQGGEPTLMGLDFFRRAVELQRQYCPPGMKINNSFQTNAVLLDDEWGRFFHDHHFLLGVSLDGPASLHDVYRLDKGGRPTFDRVLRGIELLKSHAVEFNLLACVNDQTAAHPLEVYRFFRDQVGARFIQFIPIVEAQPAASPLPGAHSVSGAAWGQFLCAIFDEWVRRDVGQVFVQLFDVALAAWAGYRPGLCVHEETCGLALAMEHNGDVYACDHFVAPPYFLGNLLQTPLQDLVMLPAQQQFGRHKKTLLPAVCRRCPVRFVCNGGCPKDRLAKTADGEAGLNILCEGYKAFFTHIDRPMRYMAELVRAQRPAAEIMTRINAPGRKRHARRGA